MSGRLRARSACCGGLPPPLRASSGPWLLYRARDAPQLRPPNKHTCRRPAEILPGFVIMDASPETQRKAPRTLSPTIFLAVGDLGRFTHQALHLHSGGWWGGPLVPGASGGGFGPALRGFVFALLRPLHRRFRVLLLRFCVWCWPRASRACGDFVFTFLASRFCVGSYRGCGGFASAFLVRRWVFLRALVLCLRLVIRVRRTSSANYVFELREIVAKNASLASFPYCV